MNAVSDLTVSRAIFLVSGLHSSKSASDDPSCGQEDHYTHEARAAGPWGCPGTDLWRTDRPELGRNGTYSVKPNDHCCFWLRFPKFPAR